MGVSPAAVGGILNASMSERYTVLLFPGGNGWTTATAPALPGCVSQGLDREEAVANVRQAIDAWIAVWVAERHRRLPSESAGVVLKGIEEALRIQRELAQEEQRDVDVALELRTVPIGARAAA